MGAKNPQICIEKNPKKMTYKYNYLWLDLVIVITHENRHYQGPNGGCRQRDGLPHGNCRFLLYFDGLQRGNSGLVVLQIGLQFLDSTQKLGILIEQFNYLVLIYTKEPLELLPVESHYSIHVK